MIAIYGKPNCPFCVKAKNLAELKKVDYVYYTMGEDYTREELLEKVPNARSVPQIFINEVSIGGFDDFEKFLLHSGL